MSTTTYNNGQPWVQQFAFNETSVSDFASWSLGHDFPTSYTANAPAAVAVTKSKVFIFFEGVIYSASIDSGGVVGTFSYYGDLPYYGIYGGAVFITKNILYYVGGRSGDWASDKVYSTPIDANGDLGSFTEDTEVLPEGRAFGNPVVTANKVYLIGGQGYSVSWTPKSALFVADIDTDGVVGSWSTGSNSLPAATNYCSVVKLNQRVYVLGGILSSLSITANTYYAQVDNDGVIGTWSSGNALAVAVQKASVVALRDRVFLFGGASSLDASLTTVQSAPITLDDTTIEWTESDPWFEDAAVNVSGSVGTWAENTTPLSDEKSGAVAFVTSSRLYLMVGKAYPSDLTYNRRTYYSDLAGGVDNYLPLSYEFIPDPYVDFNQPLPEIAVEADYPNAAAGDYEPVIASIEVTAYADNSRYASGALDLIELIPSFDGAAETPYYGNGALRPRVAVIEASIAPFASYFSPRSSISVTAVQGHFGEGSFVSFEPVFTGEGITGEVSAASFRPPLARVSAQATLYVSVSVDITPKIASFSGSIHNAGTGEGSFILPLPRINASVRQATSNSVLAFHRDSAYDGDIDAAVIAPLTYQNKLQVRYTPKIAEFAVE